MQFPFQTPGAAAPAAGGFGLTPQPATTPFGKLPTVGDSGKQAETGMAVGGKPEPLGPPPAANPPLGAGVSP